MKDNLRKDFSTRIKSESTKHWKIIPHKCYIDIVKNKKQFTMHTIDERMEYCCENKQKKKDKITISTIHF
jgi:hypothetical protein